MTDRHGAGIAPPGRHRGRALRAGVPGLRTGLCVLLLVASLPAVAEDPRIWLERMGYALEHLNYEGTLVQLHGSDAAVMRVVHRVDNGRSVERITAMDEVGREIIREGDRMTCIFPDQRTVLVERRKDRPDLDSPLRKQLAGRISFPAALYDLRLRDGGRLVGRDTRLMTVEPLDEYRYGYRLWLDMATAMPLKLQVAGDNGRVVEQILFSQIAIPAAIPAAAVQPSLPIDGFIWRRPTPPDPGEDAAVSDRWRAENLPPGFSLRAARLKPAGGTTGGGPLHHLVYGDGVASVSVFVEALAGNDEEVAEGLSRLGAANAYTTTRGGYLVTAVGEVPGITVELIAEGMREIGAASGT